MTRTILKTLQTPPSARRRWSNACAPLLGLAIALFARQAYAQAEDQAAARVLFDEAKRLMQEGKLEAACPKLEAASKLYAGSGVLLNLGDCYERSGRTASAWTTFGEAAAAAVRLSRTADEAEAKRRQSAVEPKLSRLVVRVVTETPGLVLLRDGKALDRAAWGIAMPVDSGTHSLSATAPSRQTWSTTVTVAEAGKTITVVVPELMTAPRERAPIVTPASASNPKTPPEHPAEPSYWTTRRILGVGLVGGGLVVAGAGGVVGLSAKSRYDDAAADTSSARREKSLDAVDAGNLATVVVGVGAALAIAGVVLWLTAPSARSASAMAPNPMLRF